MSGSETVTVEQPMAVLDRRFSSVRSDAVVAFALLAWVILLRFPFFYLAVGPDEGLFLTAADRMLHGARLYTDVWDNKPAGIFLIYMGIASAFGRSIAALNLVSGLTVFAAAALTGCLVRQITASRRAGLIAAFILPAYTLDLGATGAEPELFMMIPQLLACLLLVWRLQGPRGGLAEIAVPLGFGLLEGMLLMIKFPVMFETASLGLLAAGALWHETGRIWPAFRFALLAFTAFLVAPGVVFLWFAATGGLDDMIFAIFVSPRLYVSAPFGLDHPAGALMLLIRRVSYFVAPILAGTALAISLWRRGLGGRAAAPLLLPYAWAAGAVLAAASSGYFRYYYFIALIPPMTILAAIAAERALSGLQWPAQRSFAALAIAVLAVAAYPLLEHARKLDRQLNSEEVRLQQALIPLTRHLVAPGRVAFFGDMNAGLYALTGTVPATRYPQADAHVFDLPEKFGVDPVAELTRIFDRRPDVVIGSRSRFGPQSRYGALIAARLADNYRPVTVTDPWLDARIRVYRRSDLN